MPEGHKIFLALSYASEDLYLNIHQHHILSNVKPHEQESPQTS